MPLEPKDQFDHGTYFLTIVVIRDPVLCYLKRFPFYAATRTRFESVQAIQKNKGNFLLGADMALDQNLITVNLISGSINEFVCSGKSMYAFGLKQQRMHGI